MSYLRDYQQSGKQAIESALSNGSTRTLAVMPTGCGKTEMGLSVARDWPDGDVLWLAHRQELIYQPADRWHKLTGQYADIEMGEYRASNYGQNRFICASVQTLYREKRLKRLFPYPEKVGLVVVDEAHHCIRANTTYSRILEHLDHKDLRVLGLTATPDRADEQALASMFDTVAFEYPLFDPDGGPSAIGDAWLTPIRQEYVRVEGLDFSGVRTRGGDFIDSALERVLVDEKPLHRITSPTFDMAQNRQTLVFTAGIEQAARMTEILNRSKNDSAMAIVSRIPDDYKDYGSMIDSGDKDARRRHLRRFDAAKYQFLCNLSVLTEGYDCPAVSFISCARPTKSRALYSQMIGRGMRVLPDLVEGIDEHGDYWRLDSADERREAIAASEKPHLLVADFVGNSNHSLICTADILGTSYPDIIVHRAKKKLSSGDQCDMRELLEECVAEQDEADKLERENRAAIRAKADYQRKKVDPFTVLKIRARREPGWHKGRRPTPKQIAALQKFKLSDKEIAGLSFWQASKLLDRLIRRAKCGQATWKQTKILSKYGYSTELSFEQASEAITHVSQTYWKVTWPTCCCNASFWDRS